MFKKVLFVAVLASLIASAFSMPVPKLQDGNCPSSPARLKQADIAVVTVGDGETLNLRVQPNLNAERIVKIPAYTYVTIIAGPICDGGYRWYEVGWEGKDGWSAEVGPDGEYNMIPNGDPIPEVDSQENTGENNSNPFGDTPAPIFKVAAGNSYFFRDWDNFQFRTIPNDDTLEALGFPKNQIDIIPGDNLTFDSDFTFGPDVPDVHNDPDGFCTFKYKYFPSYPNPSWSPCRGIVIEPPSNTTVQPTDTPQPLIEAPIEPVAIEEPFYCSWWVIGWLACDLAEANSAQAWCEPQCMTLMRDKDHRPDMNLWSRGTGDSSPLDVLANAEKETPYNDPPKTGPLMQIRVRESTEQSEAGDLIIWQAGCGGASGVGHIGEVVSSVGITVNINDSNWDKKCSERKDVQIQILSCMRFVTKPFPAGTYVPTVQPTVINCDDYQGLQNFACNYIPWWKP